MDWEDLLSEKDIEEYLDRKMAEAEFYEEWKKEEKQLKYLEEKEKK